MEPITIRKATIHDSHSIYHIMKKVSDSLTDKSLFVCDNLEYVQNTISKNGFAVVACASNNKIVGSFLFRYPHNSPENLGYDIGLSNDTLLKVVHMESVVVLPEYRGQHLHSKMLSFGESLIDHSKYVHFLATISPDNPASFHSFEKCGYQLITTKEKYGGFIRRIYKKTIL